jgi:hypothetical protein
LAFDLYRRFEERPTLLLHEIWKMREARETYALRPPKTEKASLVGGFLIKPLRSWDVEEVG